MSMQQPGLEQLRDIHLPNPISIWPPAPGWFLLAALLIGCCVTIYFFIRRWWKKQAAKRAALKQLNELKSRYKKSQKTNEIISEISILLRRLALAYYPRIDIAGLYGETWLAFLNKTGNTTAFTDKISHVLTYGPYQQNASDDLITTFEICERWIKTASG